MPFSDINQNDPSRKNKSKANQQENDSPNAQPNLQSKEAKRAQQPIKQNENQKKLQKEMVPTLIKCLLKILNTEYLELEAKGKKTLKRSRSQLNLSEENGTTNIVPNTTELKPETSDNKEKDHSIGKRVKLNSSTQLRLKLLFKFGDDIGPNNETLNAISAISRPSLTPANDANNAITKTNQKLVKRQ